MTLFKKLAVVFMHFGFFVRGYCDSFGETEDAGLHLPFPGRERRSLHLPVKRFGQCLDLSVACYLDLPVAWLINICAR